MANSTPSLLARAVRNLRFLSDIPGWRRLVGSVVPPHSGEFVVENAGVKFAGNIRSYIDREVYLFGGYERKQIEAFLSFLPDDRRGVILDVGANVGNHALAFARVFQVVHAFEPNPMLWRQFERNVQLNRKGATVTLHRVGLADRDEELTLHMIDKPNYGLGTFSTVEQYDLPLKPVAKCAIKAGTAYLTSQGIAHVDAVKIDVQGFEPEVLRGLHAVLERDRPIIWLEIGVGTRGQMRTLRELTELVPYLFEFYYLQTKNRWFDRPDSELPLGDWVLLPAGAPSA